MKKKNIDCEKLGERRKCVFLVDYLVDYFDVVELFYKLRSRKLEFYYDEMEGYIRRIRRCSLNVDVEMEERLMNIWGILDVYYDKGKGRSSRLRGCRLNEKDNVEDSLEVLREEGL